MLFRHRWADETRPHNLLADWSQRIKKRNVYRTYEWKNKNTANRTEIFTCRNCNYDTILYSGRLTDVNMNSSAPLYCMHSVSYWRCFCRDDSASKLWGTSQGCTCGAESHTHADTHTHTTHFNSPHSKKTWTQSVHASPISPRTRE